MQNFVTELLAWYRQEKRELPWRQTRDPYRIWVSEIMLQQTRAETVIPYYSRFLQAWPTCAALADASVDEVLRMWQGLGYYSRGRNLLKGAVYIRDTYGDGMPPSFEAWLKVPGVGRYTAAAVASIALGEAVPAVDGNVLRASARLFAMGEDIAKPATRLLVEEKLAPFIPLSDAGDFTQAMIELGARVCQPAAKCSRCPVSGFCRAREMGLESVLPVKSKKPVQRRVPRGVLMAVCGGCVLLHKREERGLLAGMWEFPAWEQGEQPLPAAWGWPEKSELALEAVHIFTHIRWEMQGHLCRPAQQRLPRGDYAWVPLDSLDAYAIPGAMRAFTQYVTQLPQT